MSITVFHLSCFICLVFGIKKIYEVKIVSSIILVELIPSLCEEDSKYRQGKQLFVVWPSEKRVILSCRHLNMLKHLFTKTSRYYRSTCKTVEKNKSWLSRMDEIFKIWESHPPFVSFASISTFVFLRESQRSVLDFCTVGTGSFSTAVSVFGELRRIALTHCGVICVLVFLLSAGPFCKNSLMSNTSGNWLKLFNFFL